MLRSRIIPCLLLHNGGLVKTVRFSEPKYVGDPLNAVRIFNEKQVDELIVLDIDASRYGNEPDYGLISNLASECSMPLCYGGGVRNIDQLEHIISLGVEKVAVGSSAAYDSDFISLACQRVGSQSVVSVIDVKKSRLFGGFKVVTHNATRPTGLSLLSSIKRLERLGVGEILVNSVDRDGTMKGYDIDLIDSIKQSTHLPITVLGGAGSYSDIKLLIDRFGPLGVAAGSLFVFKGKYRAVLIQYPDIEEKAELFQPYHSSVIS